jgi:hypothetical protein
MKTNMHQTPEATEGIYPKAEMKQKKVSRMLRTQIRVSISLALCAIFLLLNSCKKEISEPKHKNDGSNVLYFNIDGKGYMLRDQCWDVPTRKTGDIFVGNDRDKKPYIRYITKFNTKSYAFHTNYCFDKISEEFRQCGGLSLFFSKGPDGYRFVKLNSALMFYSYKHNRLINIEDVNFINTPIINIEKLDTAAKIISGSLQFDFKETNKEDVSNCYIYFDLQADMYGF